MSGTVTAGLIILIVLVVLLLAGVPIGISLSVASMAAIVSSLGYAEAVSAAALRMFRGMVITPEIVDAETVRKQLELSDEVENNK